MKKVYTILALVISTAYSANAQSADVGIIAMPQFTGLINKNDFAAGKELDYASTFGYGGGLSAAYNFNYHFGIEINLVYAQQGENYKGNLNVYNGRSDTASFARLVEFQAQTVGYDATDTAYTDKASLTYFKIPVMFKWTTTTEAPVFFYLSAGPQLNILLAASDILNGGKVSYTSVVSPTLGSFSFQTKQLYNSLTYDAVLNLGAGINLSDNLVLTAQINFDYGLNDAEDKSFHFPEDFDGTSLDAHAYAANRAATNNASVGLKLGLAFKFGYTE
jgi:hypothetical protein